MITFLFTVIDGNTAYNKQKFVVFFFENPLFKIRILKIIFFIAPIQNYKVINRIHKNLKQIMRPMAIQLEWHEIYVFSEQQIPARASPSLKFKILKIGVEANVQKCERLDYITSSGFRSLYYYIFL